MSKLSKEEQARFSGAFWALEQCEKEGTEAFRKELEWRNIIGLPCLITKAQLHKFEENHKLNIIQTVLLMSEMVLADEFDFDRDMLIRFKDRFNKKTACLVDGFVNWEDIQQTLLEELNIKCPLSREILEMGKEQ